MTSHLPIEVSGVVLRELCHDDAEPYAQGTDEPAVREFGHLPLAQYTPEIVHEQIDGAIAEGLSDGSLAVLAIADARSGRLLGSLVLFDVRDDRAEVGFWLAADARGRGAAAGALEAACGLGALMGLEFLDARTSPQNVASQRVLERAGFRQKGKPLVQETPSGAVVPVLTFGRSLDKFRSGPDSRPRAAVVARAGRRD